MAVHVKATIVPSKLQLLQDWVPHQTWLDGMDASMLTPVGSYRFDDPDGEVGIETHLLATADGAVLQVPLTYRGVPLPDGDAALITTMTHTVLGDRWVYDACHDPVYVQMLLTTILTGSAQADIYLRTDSGLVRQPLSTYVRGTGTPGLPVPDVQGFTVTHIGRATRVHFDYTITVLRAPAGDQQTTSDSALVGTWPGRATPTVLATVVRRPSIADAPGSTPAEPGSA